jgi:hypothetical protein
MQKQKVFRVSRRFCGSLLCNRPLGAKANKKEASSNRIKRPVVELTSPLNLRQSVDRRALRHEFIFVDATQ